MSVCCRNLACWTAEGSAGRGLREGISGSGWQERSQRFLAIFACLREDAARPVGTEMPAGRESV
jgi:hypothetical protein